MQNWIVSNSYFYFSEIFTSYPSSTFLVPGLGLGFVLTELENQLVIRNTDLSIS